MILIDHCTVQHLRVEVKQDVQLSLELVNLEIIFVEIVEFQDKRVFLLLSIG